MALKTSQRAQDLEVQLQRLEDPATSPGESNQIIAGLFSELFDLDREAAAEKVEEAEEERDERVQTGVTSSNDASARDPK